MADLREQAAQWRKRAHELEEYAAQLDPNGKDAVLGVAKQWMAMAEQAERIIALDASVISLDKSIEKPR